MTTSGGRVQASLSSTSINIDASHQHGIPPKTKLDGKTQEPDKKNRRKAATRLLARQTFQRTRKTNHRRDIFQDKDQRSAFTVVFANKTILIRTKEQPPSGRHVIGAAFLARSSNEIFSVLSQLLLLHRPYTILRYSIVFSAHFRSV